MTTLADTIMILLVLTDFILLGSSLLRMCIRIVALQGVLLGILPLVTSAETPVPQMVYLAAGTILLKGIIFPKMLMRALRETNTRREIEPFVGHISSLFIGLAALGISIWLASRLPVSRQAVSSMGIPAALLTILSGLFLIVSRKKALTQVIGYLMMENGIYAFGVLFVLAEPLLVEMSILLDVFVAVFLMGVIIFHISRSFDHIDVDRMTDLHDRTGATIEDGNP